MTDKLNQSEKQTAKCAECRREFNLGDDCIRVQSGVIGPRGFVPLKEPKHLCDHVCMRNYFGNGEIEERLARRIP